MNADTIISIYAAVVATAVLIWGVVKELRKERTKIAVSLSAGTKKGFGLLHEKVPTVEVRVTNRSAHDVVVAGYRIEAIGGRPFAEASVREPALKPFMSETHDMPQANLREQGIDLSRPVVGQVRLADGREFCSKAKRLVA